MTDPDNTYDVVIIGAGISGINAAYRLQTEFPDAKYTILEGRDVIGGTWELFKYPGIRSDSEIYSFAFAWSPWDEGDTLLADGPSIRNYIKKTASRHHIDERVQFKTTVTDLAWQSDIQRWRISSMVDTSPNPQVLYARFVIGSTGYYDYSTPHQTTIPGLNNFAGQTIHPQFWPADLDYTDRKIVIIGSGATAVTLLPSLAKNARHVTMLQRSPGWFITLPNTEAIDTFIKKVLPPSWAFSVIRLRLLVLSFIFIQFCYFFPKLAGKVIRAGVRSELPPDIPVDPHFAPKYNPFEQRLCIAPDGDFFKTLREKKGDIVTDVVQDIQGNTILLESGQKIDDVDIIVTATGLKLKLIGGVSIGIDGVPVDISTKYVWRSTCLQDVPNLCFILGYVDNTWTLGSDSSARLFVRLMRRLHDSGGSSFVPVVEDHEKDALVETPLIKMSSGYIERAKSGLPRAALTAPWKPRWHYFQDWWFAGYGNVEKGIKIIKVSS